MDQMKSVEILLLASWYLTDSFIFIIFILFIIKLFIYYS